MISIFAAMLTADRCVLVEGNEYVRVPYDCILIPLNRLGALKPRSEVLAKMRRRLARAAPVADENVRRMREQWRRAMGWAPSDIYIARRLRIAREGE